MLVVHVAVAACCVAKKCVGRLGRSVRPKWRYSNAPPHGPATRHAPAGMDRAAPLDWPPLLLRWLGGCGGCGGAAQPRAL